jgi:hypothetical protein
VKNTNGRKNSRIPQQNISFMTVGDLIKLNKSKLSSECIAEEKKT